MKTIKNKEVIIGLIALIILCILAIFLIIKREFPKENSKKAPIEIIEDKDAAMSENEEQDPEADIIKQELAKVEKEELAKSKETSSKTEISMADEMNQLGISDTGKETVYYTAPKYAPYDGEDMWQLEELYFYWNDYKLDAVNDLLRLPRVRTAFTNELAGTNQFYYYGTLNSAGQPDGSGVAVYEDNAYYCGEWKNGKRHGKGMWLQIFPDKPTTLNGISGVLEHSFNGQWQDDLPYGNGQEHIEYDLEVMEGEDIIFNVIGSFKEGYYDGELYIMTIDNTGTSTDWEATAKRGVFDYFHKRYSTTGKLPVWERMEEVKEGTNYRWLDEPENIGWGITGLKKKDTK